MMKTLRDRLGGTGRNQNTPRQAVGKPLGADGHVLVVGGPGSGKTSCIAIPTLRDGWRAATLVVDIKGELLSKSGRPQACVFNPLDNAALGYDPFYLLHGNPYPNPDIEDIALTIVPQPPPGKDDFWSSAARDILAGHLLFCFKQGKTFVDAMQLLLSTPAKPLLQTETNMDADVHPYLMQHASAPDKTFGNIMQELSIRMRPFVTDKQLVAALLKQDIITPQLLEQGYDIFLQLPAYKLEQWRALFALIVQQFSRHFERRPEAGVNIPILFLLDEFPRLGKLDIVVQGLATLRSKKITIMLIIQSLAQLESTYGQDQRKVVCDNCSYKAILQVNDADSQKYFSALVGTEERDKFTRTSKEASTWNYIMTGETGGADSVSVTTIEQPRIKPEEFAYLKDIVLLTPQGVQYVQKRPYYLQCAEQNSPPAPFQTASKQPGLPGKPTATCPGCGAINRTTAKFCRGCGSALDGK